MAVLLRYGLKKVRGSTLVEVLVASIVIIIIFAIASMSLNNIFKSTIKSNTIQIENELNRLQYFHHHQKIGVNYSADFGDWEILVARQQENSSVTTVLQATNAKIQQKITRRLHDEISQ